MQRANPFIIRASRHGGIAGLIATIASLITMALLGNCLGDYGDLPPGALCSNDAECEHGLLCAYGRCRSECTSDHDCTEGRCVVSETNPDVGLCTVTQDSTQGTVCPEGEVAVGEEQQCVPIFTAGSDADADEDAGVDGDEDAGVDGDTDDRVEVTFLREILSDPVSYECADGSSAEVVSLERFLEDASGSANDVDSLPDSYDTGECDPGCVLSDASQSLCVFVARSLTLETDLRVIGSRPFAILSFGSTSLKRLEASAQGDEPGPGGQQVVPSSGSNGIESGGGGGGAGYGNGGSGGCGGGGDGGEGSQSCSRAVFSGGGSGGKSIGALVMIEALGGGGGGALYLWSAEAITAQGISANGGNGQFVLETGGGGGGGGGMIVLEAPKINFRETIEARGGNGSDGDHVDALGESGGDGETPGGMGTTGICPRDPVAGGGGGGGVGHVIVRADSCNVPTIVPHFDDCVTGCP